MATIAENLLALQQTKENFKTAFAEKGVDVSNTPFTEYPNKFSEIQTGGGAGGETSGDYFVKVIDYDGTILKEANLNAGDTFELPTPPSHNGLIFQEWSCSQDIVDNVITIEDNNVMVGAVYTTESGLNEFDIELTKVIAPDIETNGFVVKLNMDGTKDWGDGTSDDLTTHTYTSYGKYTIKCNGTTMTTSNYSSGLFGQTSSVKNDYCVNVRLSKVNYVGSGAFFVCNSLKSVTISNDIPTVNDYVFNNCKSLKSVIMPNSVTGISSNVTSSCYSLESVVIPNTIKNKTIYGYAFQNCYLLKNIVIPNGVTTIQDQIFASCYSLTNIIIPNSVTSIGVSVLNSCYSLKSVRLSNNISSFKDYVFAHCYTLENIVIPSSVTSIARGPFSNNYALNTCDFSTHTSIPSLSNASFSSSVKGTFKIIVPDELYDEWIVATNWATNAKYIYKASEVQL